MMSKDDKVIGYLTPADMAALMSETGMITVQETSMAAGQPVIHAALKVINAQTGEQLPGGLPFSVVMFKTAREPGYSNIAIGTVVPVAELGVALPRDYFNFANQRYRFARVFPLDERSFVLQMDLFLHAATREYVKFSFGLWAALFAQVLFDLMGKGGEKLNAAAEAYAAARTDLAQQFVATTVASDEPVAEETASIDPVIDLPAEVPAETVLEPVIEPVGEVIPAAAAEPVAEAVAEPAAEAAHDLPVDEVEPVKVEAKVEPTAEAPVEAVAEASADASAEVAATAEPEAAPVAEAKEPETV